MANDRFRSLASSVANALAPRRRASMTIEEKYAFDIACSKYDLEAKEAKRALVQMIAILPAPGIEQDPETRAALYWNVLKTELSPHSITRVCDYALRGHLGKFLPPPGEMITFAHENYIQGYSDPIEIDPRIGPPILGRVRAPEHKLLTEKDAITSETIRAQVSDQFKNLAGELVKKSAVLKPMPAAPSTYGPVVPARELRAMDAGELAKHRIEAEDYLAKLDHSKRPTISPQFRAILDKMASREEP